MSPNDLLDFYKTQSAIAKAVGIKQPSVAEWFASGVVPETRQFQFEVLTAGKLRADRTSGTPPCVRQSIDAPAANAERRGSDRPTDPIVDASYKLARAVLKVAGKPRAA